MVDDLDVSPQIHFESSVPKHHMTYDDQLESK